MSRLEAMRPDPDADGGGGPSADAVDTLADGDLTFRIWGGDWCPDCTDQLPQFAAALDAAGVPDDRVEQFPVEKVDGEKRGPGMDEYRVEYIPTVVVSRDGEELARFVESGDVPIAEYLARELESV